MTDSEALADRIVAARGTHARLRSVPVSADTLDEKRPLYDSIKGLFDELWQHLNETPNDNAAKAVRSAIRGLTVDAEWHAGLQNEAEGYRDAADVTDQYRVLENYLRNRDSENELRTTGPDEQ